MSEPRKSEAVTTFEVVFPTDTNHYGSLFGGRLISWMDKAAYYAAVRFSGFAAVTASVERINFAVALRTGDMLELRAQVIYTGRTSMVIKVDVYAINMGSDRDKKLTNTGYFTFVALGEDGRPRRVPGMIVESEEEKSLFELGRSVKADLLARRRGGEAG